MPDQINDQIKKGEDAVKKLGWDALVHATLASYGANYFPFTLLMVFTDKLWEMGRLQGDLFAISFMNEAAQRENTTAQVNLLIVGQAKGFDSPEFKKAREDSLNAVVKHLSHTGA